VDQRTVVEYKADLYKVNKPYVGIVVTVLQDDNNEKLGRYMYQGGDKTKPEAWLALGTANSITSVNNLVDELTEGPDGIPTVWEKDPKNKTVFVYRRGVGQPATPTGGDFETGLPVTDGWYPYVVKGKGPVWITSCYMEDNYKQEDFIWNIPTILADTDFIDYEFCRTKDVPDDFLDDGVPDEPVQDPDRRTYWHNKPTQYDDWMAIGTKIDGAYPEPGAWKVLKINGDKGEPGDQGPSGLEYKNVNYFTRSNADLTKAVVAGGTFDDPSPTITTINGAEVDGLLWSDFIIFPKKP